MANRRGSGEGHISHKQRADGRFEARIDLGIDATGKRRYKSVYGKTRKEVAEKLAQLQTQRKQGVHVAAKKQTVSEYLEHWLEDVVKPRVRAKTHGSYAQTVRLYIEPALGRIELTKLNPQDIQQFLNRLSQSNTVKGTPMKARTPHLAHSVLRNALEQAVKWGLIARNPATLIDTPRNRKQEARYLTPDQALHFLESVRGSKHECIFTIAIMCGLRQGELLALQWSDVDFEKRTLTVRKALQRITLPDAKFGEQSTQLTVVEPKSKASRRTIPLGRVALQALRAHRDRQRFAQEAAGERWAKTLNLVFTTMPHPYDLRRKGGMPLDGPNLTRDYQQALARAGLPKTRFHDLRHTCASLLLSQGTHMKVVQQILGHSDFYLTMNTYTHVVQELERDAADRMDALFVNLDQERASND